MEEDSGGLQEGGGATPIHSAGYSPGFPGGGGEVMGSAPPGMVCPCHIGTCTGTGGGTEWQEWVEEDGGEWVEEGLDPGVSVSVQAVEPPFHTSVVYRAMKRSVRSADQGW